jgi:hypothetical protein
MCSWANPGADPYTGTPTAAIMAKTQIPLGVRLTLAARVSKHRPEFDDLVFIDRDSIRSRQHAYDPDISDMVFGKGHRCLGVDRSAWAPSHVETAMVFCEAGWCVARPAVCNNWSVVRRTDWPAAPRVEYPGRGFAAAEEGAPETPVDRITAVADVPEPVDERISGFDAPRDRWVDQPGMWVPVVYAAPGIPVTVPAVPEPGVWAMLLAGAVLVWGRRWNR